MIVWPYDFYLRQHRRLRQNWPNFNLRLSLRNRQTVLISIIAGGLIISFNNLQAKQLNRQLTTGQNNLIYPLVKNEFDGTIIDDYEPAAVPATSNGGLQIKADNSERGVGIPTDLPLTLVGGGAVLKPNIINSQASIALRQETEKYTVQPGDTLASIAKQFGLSLNTLLWENNLRSGSLIRPGQSLTILPVNGISYKIKSGDTLSAIANRYRVSVDAITEANPLNDKLAVGQTIIIPGAQPLTTRSTTVASTVNQPSQSNVQPSGSNAPLSNTRLQWPTVRRRITQYYSWRHTGLDVADKIGTPIYAAEDGVVSVAGWNRGGYGYYIIIDHGGGLQTLYGHNSKLFVSIGDRVNRGQEIAAMGSTGRSTGPHIHFEVRLNGRRVNPLSYTR